MNRPGLPTYPDAPHMHQSFELQQKDEPKATKDVKKPDHWQVVKHHAALGRLGIHASHITYHDEQSGLGVKWNSREHRKGHFPRFYHLQYGHPLEHKHKPRVPKLIGFDITDISWWVAFLFTIGSCVWVVNGWFSMFSPSSENTDLYVVGYTALVGGTIFELGGIAGLLEALNAEPEVRVVPKEHLTGTGVVDSAAIPSRKQQLQQQEQHPITVVAHDGSSGTDDGDAPVLSQVKKWKWWGFKWRNMGWLGSFIQMIAATVFWIATITGVPGVLPSDQATSYGLWDGVFWVPQVIGGLGFIISSTMFMLETQKHWWQPRPLNMGWHVGFWNLIGGIGFFLSGVFGLYAEPAGKYQLWGTFFSTFWGSWAFLLGSYIQLVEAINKHH